MPRARSTPVSSRPRRGGDGLFQMRLYFMDWFGSMAEKILDLPAAFIAFGIGMTLLIAFDGVQRDRARKPLLF
jgi:hypothetical protein